MAMLSGVELTLEEERPDFGGSDDFLAVSENYWPEVESDADSGRCWYSDSRILPESSFYLLLDGEPDENSLDSETRGDFRFMDYGPGDLVPASEFNLWGFEDDEEREDEEGLGFGLRVASRNDTEPINWRGDGLRFAGTDSESEFDDGVFDLDSTDNGYAVADSGLPPVWDSFLAEEEVEETEVLDWEEVQNAINGTRDSVAVLEEELPSLSVLSSSRDDVEQHDQDLDWEVLLAVNNVVDYIEQAEGIGVSILEETDPDYYNFLASHYDNGADYGDYDAIFGHMLDDDIGIRGSPPAAVRVVEGLPVVEFSVEELMEGNIACAICKEEVKVKEKLRKLPCHHFYHEECIFPWLEIRNTCPVCRFELPTDDAAYERRRTTQRVPAG